MDRLKVRCVKTEEYVGLGEYKRWRWQTGLILNDIYLVKQDIWDQYAFHVFKREIRPNGSSFIDYVGIYPKDNFMTVEEWRDKQIDIINESTNRN
jgi:hypothetical protein